MDDLVAVPEWTQVQQKSGLDPLGMQASGVRLYQDLLPGISNVTLRIRYYGLYPWLTNDYARKFHDPDPEHWKKVVRRAEALYALAAAKVIETRWGRISPRRNICLRRGAVHASRSATEGTQIIAGLFERRL
jgi:hypothetical protein